MTQLLLSSTTFGTAGGNYNGSSASFNSKQIRASGYEGYTNGLHTVVGVVKNFVGIITIQGTLTTTPSTDEDWFNITVLIGDGSSIVSNGAVSNITLSATYIRLNVSSFTAGNITSVHIRH